MRKFLAVFGIVFLFASTASAQQVFHDVSAPTLYNFFGTGAEADPAVSNVSSCTANLTPYACCTGSGTGTCTAAQTIQGKHYYKSFSVDSTGTVTVGTSGGNGANHPVGALFAYVQGACTVAGTINAVTQNSSTSIGGASGGGGGFGAANGAAGSNVQVPGGPGNVTLASGGAAGTSGNPGGTGNTVSSSSQNDILDFINAVEACGGSAGGTGGSSGGAGGNGGGCVILDCNSIVFTGTINANGSAGAAGGSNTGGGGGGGGGIIVLAAQTFTTNTGTLNVAGGTQGAVGSGTSTHGGTGGNGWTATLTLNQ